MVKKAKHNYEVAVFAENNKHYDSAVSRYYYYIFQNIIAYMNKLNLIQKNKFDHKLTISDLIKHIKKQYNISDIKIIDITKLWRLKDKRHSSDYSDKEMIETEKQFNNSFKNDFLAVEQALKNCNIME